jgi:hypothetical protein
VAIALDTLAYARQLREVGFSEEQAEGQARALAAAMTDTLVTKQDLREGIHDLEGRMDARFAQIDARFAQINDRFDYLEKHLDVRLAEQEKRIEIRFGEQTARMGELSARFDGRLADLERRITVRLGAMMVGTVGIVSALVKLL